MCATVLRRHSAAATATRVSSAPSFYRRSWTATVAYQQHVRRIQMSSEFFFSRLWCRCTLAKSSSAFIYARQDVSVSEYSMFVPAGSFLQIPWQNPAHTNNCHEIAIQTSVTNVSLVRSKALFAESTFNMSVDPLGNILLSVLCIGLILNLWFLIGHLSLAVYDGFFFNHRSTEKRWNLSDNIMHHIAFCASETSFNLTVSEYCRWALFRSLENKPKPRRVKALLSTTFHWVYGHLCTGTVVFIFSVAFKILPQFHKMNFLR